MLNIADFALPVDAAMGRRGASERRQFELVPGDFPQPPDVLHGDGLGLLLGRKQYHQNQPSLCVEILAERKTLRALALSVLAVTLAGHEGQELEIVCPWSSSRPLPEHLRPIDALVVSVGPASVVANGGLLLRPASFVYEWKDPGRHPLSDSIPLPHLYMAFPRSLSHDRALVHGFGPASGAGAFATALFDVYFDDGVEYDFEGPYGCGGVSAGSLEVKLWLPGSIGWDLYGGEHVPPPSG